MHFFLLGIELKEVNNVFGWIVTSIGFNWTNDFTINDYTINDYTINDYTINDYTINDYTIND